MKYLILFFISLPAFAGPFDSYEKCRADVARIRNTHPARSISKADYEKMLNGCKPPEFVSDADAEKEGIAPPAPVDTQAEMDALSRLQAITAQQIQETDAHLARLNAAAQATQPSVTCTSFSFGGTVQTTCN